ncbi:hypothetical protein BUE76_22270 [Cnuella takakiae]|nr:hypothetical protein BUE76_22270 [Cnuella takakiae]
MSDIQKSYQHKANLYMVKPFSSEHLRNALETILKKDSWQAAYLQHHYIINNRFVPFTVSIGSFFHRHLAFDAALSSAETRME